MAIYSEYNFVVSVYRWVVFRGFIVSNCSNFQNID